MKIDDNICAFTILTSLRYLDSQVFTLIVGKPYENNCMDDNCHKHNLSIIMNKATLFFQIILFVLPGIVGAKHLVNVNESGVILQGYDAVALVTMRQAVPGHFNYQKMYKGAIYYFQSAENLAAFNAQPETYVPQFGGFCAVAASQNRLVPGQITNWDLVEGKLFILCDQAVQIWKEKKVAAIVTQAMEHWNDLHEKYTSDIKPEDVYQGQLTLEAAKRIGEKAMKYLKENDAPGGSIAIVDDAGFVIYQIRATGTFSAASDIAMGKARSSALFGFETKTLEDAIGAGRNSLITANYNMMKGGLPIIYNGEIIGGIGVSGASSSDQDLEIAKAGLADE